MSVEDVLARTGPRRLLALDGGGIRAMLSLQILKKIESHLRELTGNPQLVLADYFDYVAGSSIGALVATGVALGKSMDEMNEFFQTRGAEMFARAGLWQLWRHRFTAARLSETLQREIGKDVRLGDPQIRTLLMLVLRNATTDSSWPVSNNPRGRFNDRSLSGCNLDIPLWQLVRASTAAPSYFEPEVLSIEGQDVVFVDGAITSCNNPAFQLFLMATAAPYRLCWPAGEEELLIVSIGTGSRTDSNKKLNPRQMNLLYHAQAVPAALISAGEQQTDLICRVFGRCLAGPPVDTEVGDLHDGIDIDGQTRERSPVFQSRSGPVPKLFTYLRYTADLSPEGLQKLGVGHIDAQRINRMDAPENMPDLRTIGELAAERDVKADVLARFLPSRLRSVPPDGNHDQSRRRRSGQDTGDNQSLLDEANRTGAWFHARKTRTIWVRQVAAAQKVRTLEGEIEVAAGDVICRGEAGDLWPQSQKGLAERYDPTEDVDSEGWRKYLPRPFAEGVMAVQLDHPFDVEGPWGRLSGKGGDFLVKRHEDREVAYPADVWVVDQTLFRQTYETVP